MRKQILQVLCALGFCVLFGVVTVTGDYISAFEETIPVLLEASEEEGTLSSSDTPFGPVWDPETEGHMGTGEAPLTMMDEDEDLESSENSGSGESSLAPSSSGSSSQSGSSGSETPSSSSQQSPSSPPPASQVDSNPPESSSSAASSSKPSSSSSSKPSSSQSGSSSSESESSISSGDTLNVIFNGVKQSMDGYTALCMIVEAEMGSTFTEEALKAQAVAAYSYIKYENNRGSYASLPSKTPSEKVKNAVAAVYGQMLTYNGSVAFTPYYACSSGITNSSAETWGGSYPYLVSVNSAYDPPSTYKNNTVSFSADTIKSYVESALGITLDASSPESWFSITSVNQGGYVLSMTVTDEDGNVTTITGRNFRETVLGYRIKSHAFTILFQNGTFTITTNGYGHGCGMSQLGANNYVLNEGWTYRDILSHYYPGTTLK